MISTTGCLSLAGIVSLSIGLTNEALGQSACPFMDRDPPASVMDSLTTYGACGTNPYESVCAASIVDAISCAGSYFSDPNTPSVGVYTIVLGTATATSHLVIDLTNDPSGNLLTKPAFQINHIHPLPFDLTGATGKCGSTSCLVIEGGGDDSSSLYTTLVTPAGPPAFYGADVSHLLIRHLTLMQHADATVQGVAVCSPGTSCQGSTTIITIVDGVPVTKSFPTMMVAVNQPTNLVQDPSAFASVANSGSFPACTSPATSCTVSGTLAAAGSACLSPAVINVTVTQSAAGWGATKVVGIVTPASGCTTYPTSATPVASSFPGMTGTENPTFYVAYYPSPLSMWNVGNNTPDPGTGAAIRAFTNTTTPAKIVTATSGPASGVDPKEWWGFPTFTPGTTGITVPTPPGYNGVSGNYALWTITMDTALTGNIF